MNEDLQQQRDILLGDKPHHSTSSEVSVNPAFKESFIPQCVTPGVQPQCPLCSEGIQLQGPRKPSQQLEPKEQNSASKHFPPKTLICSWDLDVFPTQTLH